MSLRLEASWLLDCLEQLSPAFGCHDLLWCDVGRHALETLRAWRRGETTWQPEGLVRLYWKCQQLRKCLSEALEWL